MSEARVFLSYPRGEKDAVFAAALKAAIERTPFDANRHDADLVAKTPGLPITLPDGPPIEVWRDINHLRGGDGWWSHIEAVLKSDRLHHLVLVVTPRTLESDITRRELHYARSCGKQISPIKGPDYDQGVPRWLGQLYDLDIPEQAAVFVEAIKGPSRAKPVLHEAPPLKGFIERPKEFAEIKAALLDRAIDKDVAITALKGGGGYGKTMLATALLQDPDIQDAFDDGIAWVTIGREQPDLLPKITSLIGRLTGKRGESTDLDMAGRELASALGHRCILLVIDDVWRRRDVEPFLIGGPNARRLITTRNNSALPTDIEPNFVDEMQSGDAKRLLTRDFGPADVAAHAKAFEDLGVRFGGWAQGLAIVNGYLREQCKWRMPLADALINTLGAVNAQGLAALEPVDKSDHTQTVSRTVELSLSLLDAASRERFLELAIFPEDVDIPIGLIEGWWAARRGLSAQAVEKFLFYLDDLSLLQQIDLEKQTIRLHDNIVDELRRLAAPNLPHWHKDFVGVLHSASADAYRYKFKPFHLQESGEQDALDRLLLDPDWIGGKLRALGAQELAADYREPPGYGSLRAHPPVGPDIERLRRNFQPRPASARGATLWPLDERR